MGLRHSHRDVISSKLQNIFRKRATTRLTSRPDEGRGPRRFFDFSGRELTFFRNSLLGCVGSGRRRRSVAKGWGPGQHASRDTIPERWGERAHPRTQAQLSLNRSALICEHMQKKYPDVCITYIRVEICTLMLAKGSVNIFLSM